MHDPEFQQPVEKYSGTSVDGLAPAPPPCKLANVSLIFGILGFVPLPVMGSLIAIVTGHIAMGEIRASEGRLGGRPAAKAGLMLGYLAVFLAVLTTAVIVGFTTRTVRHMVATPAPYGVSGVKMANEMSQNDYDAFMKLKLRAQTSDGEVIADIAGDEEIIASFSDSMPDDGVPALAVLTNQRIVYIKGDRFTSFALKDIDAILSGDAYMKKYHPAEYSLTRYMIEIKRRSGGRMRIAITPTRDGPSFDEALQDAWKAAGGKPEAVMKK